MLFVQRGTAHFPLPPQCVAVGKKKSGTGTLVYAFNPLTGKPADRENPNGLLFPYDIVQVSLLPLTGSFGFLNFYPVLSFICIIYTVNLNGLLIV